MSDHAQSAGTTRSRRLTVALLLSIGCLTASVLLLLATTAGGITYLVLQKRAAEATTTFTGATYAFGYPVDWHRTTTGVELPDPDQVLELRNDDTTKYVTVLDRSGAMSAAGECSDATARTDSQGLGTDQNEVIGARDVDGREALHHRAVATDLDGEHSSSVVDTWCIPKPDGVVLFVAQTFSDDDSPESMPDAERILDSWEWTVDGLPAEDS